MKEIPVNFGRKLSLEQVKLVGEGYASWVYELENGDVVKVLKHNGREDAEREIRLAKWAFLKGIPTAISYDVVDVDGHPGLVYESLGRDNLRNAFRDHPERFDDILSDYLTLLRTVNGVCDEEGRLPNAIDLYRTLLQDVAGLLTPDETAKASALLSTVPETNHIIHGDCQIKNVRIVDGKLFLIDLDTLSRGDPIFELAALFICYRGYPTLSDEEFDSFFEISKKTTSRILDGLLDGYYPNISEAAKQENARKVAFLGWLSMLARVKADMPEDEKALEMMLGRFRDALNGVNDLCMVRK